MGQAVSQLEESDLFPFFRFETALDEIDDYTVRARAAALRKRLNTPRNTRRQTDALAHTSLGLGHDVILHHDAPRRTTTHHDAPTESKLSAGDRRPQEKKKPSRGAATSSYSDWGWLVYGMVAFAACLHDGELTDATWLAALKEGTYPRCDSSGIILRECFPTATISTLRTANREPDVERALRNHQTRSEVQAVLQYSRFGVKGVKRPGQTLYDRADALVAALGALPHVADGFREVPNWATDQSRWNAAVGDEQVEGTFLCVV